MVMPRALWMLVALIGMLACFDSIMLFDEELTIQYLQGLDV